MNLDLQSIDLDVNPFAGSKEDECKSLRVLALEMIVERNRNRAQLALFVRNMRRASGPEGFTPEVRRLVQDFVRSEVASAGGRPAMRAFVKEAEGLLLIASHPQTEEETAAQASLRKTKASMQARLAKAAAILLGG